MALNYINTWKENQIKENKIMELFDCVKLIKPFEDLKVGTKGAIVEKYNDDNFEVEFFDENGDTIDVFTISKEYLEVYWVAKDHKK